MSSKLFCLLSSPNQRQSKNDQTRRLNKSANIHLVKVVKCCLKTNCCFWCHQPFERDLATCFQPTEDNVLFWTRFKHQEQSPTGTALCLFTVCKPNHTKMPLLPVPSLWSHHLVWFLLHLRLSHLPAGGRQKERERQEEGGEKTHHSWINAFYLRSSFLIKTHSHACFV